MNASLTPSSSIPAFQLTRNPHGRLVLTLADGTAHEGVTPVGAFPSLRRARGSLWWVPTAMNCSGFPGWRP